jgi:hypothetical protein
MALTLEDLAGQLKAAIETSDLDGLAALLATDVRWGPPGDPVSGCHNRNEVRAWYGAAFSRGVRATVNEVTPSEGCLLVGLTVSGASDDADGGGTAERWQVLTVREGLISDIRGFDSRAEAAAHAGIGG